MVSRQKPDYTVKLYPQGQGSDMGIVENGVKITLGPGEMNGISKPEECDGRWMSNVTDPRMDIYLPEKNSTGQMMIICPGGGYAGLSVVSEGALVADWCIERGMAACVLYYRMPNGHNNVPLTDVQNAFRYCRHHSAEWDVRQIGIIGFSAGGHLAASASTLFADDVTRPDFSVLMYPVISLRSDITHKGTRTHLTGNYVDLVEYYCLDQRVTEKTSPAIIFLCSDDTAVPPENSILYYRQLIAHNVPAQLHIFPSGGHGWGFMTNANEGHDAIGDGYRAVLDKSLETFLEDLRK